MIFAGFIKIETIRLIRNNSDEDQLFNELANLKSYLLNRGYKQAEINRNIRSALTNKRSELLKKSQRKEKKGIPLVLVTKYHHSFRRIGFYIRKNWHKLRRDARCAKLFNYLPIVAYSGHKNIADYIINSKV